MTASLRTRVVRLLTLLVLTLTGAVVALAATAVPASAHNVLTSTSPTAQAQVGKTPAEVVLTFDEPAVGMGTQVVVTGPSGPVQLGNPVLVDDTVTQPLQPGAPAGSYSVAWRVTSADGHPITGTFAFTSSAAGDGQPPSASATPSLRTTNPGPASPFQGIPSWLLITIGVVVIAFAVKISRDAKRNPPGRNDHQGRP